jgi:hypothetical protein
VARQWNGECSDALFLVQEGLMAAISAHVSLAGVLFYLLATVAASLSW